MPVLNLEELCRSDVYMRDPDKNWRNSFQTIFVLFVEVLPAGWSVILDLLYLFPVELHYSCSAVVELLRLGAAPC